MKYKISILHSIEHEGAYRDPTKKEKRKWDREPKDGLKNLDWQREFPFSYTKENENMAWNNCSFLDAKRN